VRSLLTEGRVPNCYDSPNKICCGWCWLCYTWTARRMYYYRDSECLYTPACYRQVRWTACARWHTWPCIMTGCVPPSTASALPPPARQANPTVTVQMALPMVTASKAIQDSTLRLQLPGLRHPLLEKSLGAGKYIPSDLALSGEQQMCLITGPNMGGKSTFMRAVGLVVVLAQMGSFVPATHAHLQVGYNCSRCRCSWYDVDGFRLHLCVCYSVISAQCALFCSVTRCCGARPVFTCPQPMPKSTFTMSPLSGT
jgi:hypothetical protein